MAFTQACRLPCRACLHPEVGRQDCEVPCWLRITAIPALVCLQAEELKQDADMSMPAAWRVDSYLDDDDAAGNNFAAVRSHRLQFAKEPNAKDDMARKDNLDDLMVRLVWLYQLHERLV